MKKNLLLLAMLFGAMFTFTACGGDDDDDNGGGGGGATYEDSRITSVIPDTYLKQLAKHMSIYDGVTPPTIEGRYVMAPTKLLYDSNGWNGGDTSWADNYFTFSNQSSSNRTVAVSQTTNSGYSGSGTGAYICGKNNNFTIYFNETGVSYGINYKQAVIISGVKTSSGIRNLTKAFVMVERGEKTGDTDIMKVGEYRIFTDEDGMSDPAQSSSAKGAAVTGQFASMNVQ